MRPINFIYVEAITQEDLIEENKKWKEAGFEYVPFHYMLNFSEHKADNGAVIVKGRPLNMNNGLIRDSFLSAKGIGVLLVVNEYGNIPISIYKQLGKLIKQTTIDIGLTEYQLATNYSIEERKLDIVKLHSEILNAEVEFLKIK